MNPNEKAMQIFDLVCQDRGVLPSQITHLFRGKENIAYARQEISYLIYKLTNFSHNKIAEIVNRHRTTVLISITAVQNRCRFYPEYRQRIIELEQKAELIKDAA